MLKVYLGGTCAGSEWRTELVEKLNDNIQVFSPVLDKWCSNSSDNYDIKQQTDFILYVLTPETKGFMSIANAVDASNKMPEKLLFCYLPEYNNQKFNNHNLECMKAIKNLIKNNGAKVFDNLNKIADFLNNNSSNLG